jgi:hypothetical protein
VAIKSRLEQALYKPRVTVLVWAAFFGHSFGNENLSSIKKHVELFSTSKIPHAHINISSIERAGTLTICHRAIP